MRPHQRRTGHTMHKRILISILLFAAMALVLYPFAANLYNRQLQKMKTVEYTQNIAEAEDGQITEMLEAAKAWNAELYSSAESGYFPEDMSRTEIYESLLDTDGEGMMGYIEIPKIGVSLPIYHYTSDEVLTKGAGHLESSSLPVGGEYTHCVLAAHRGLLSSEMFTNLDKLEDGDVFYLQVLSETLAYEVISVQVVEPDETDALLPQANRDLCTLVTCTPYGINTHRLLVTGERTEYNEDEAADTTRAAVLPADQLLLLAAAGAEFAVYVVLMRRMRREKQA